MLIFINVKLQLTQNGRNYKSMMFVCLSTCLSIQRMTRNINSIYSNFGVRKIHWRRDRLPTPVFLGFLWGSAGKESACNAGDLGSMPGLGRCPAEGKDYRANILAWRIPWFYSPLGRRVRHDWVTFTFTRLFHSLYKYK